MRRRVDMIRANLPRPRASWVVEGAVLVVWCVHPALAGPVAVRAPSLPHHVFSSRVFLVKVRTFRLHRCSQKASSSIVRTSTHDWRRVRRGGRAVRSRRDGLGGCRRGGKFVARSHSLPFFLASLPALPLFFARHLSCRLLPPSVCSCRVSHTPPKP